VLHCFLAEQQHATAIANLINLAYRGEVSRQGWTTEADMIEGLRTTPQEISGILEAAHSFFMLGSLAGEIVATTCCSFHDGEARLSMIAVSPPLQNQGYGKTMIQAAENLARRQWSVRCYKMHVITMRETLIAFYERLGYQRTGLVKAFPTESDLWQVKVAGLQFAVLEKPLPA